MTHSTASLKRALTGALAALTLTLGSLTFNAQALDISSANLRDLSGHTVTKKEGKDFTLRGPGFNSRTVLSWGKFDVLPEESVHFENGSFLNLVTGGRLSVIAGKIESDGSLFLVNPAGVRLAAGSDIYVNDAFGISTIKPTEALVKNFNSTGKLMPGSHEIYRGMGKVSLLGKIRTNHLHVYGSQLVIRDYSALKTNDTLNDIVLTNSGNPNDPNSTTLLLKSSTGRIDVGGPAPGTGEDPDFDPESAYGVSAADGLTDQRGKTGVGTKEELLDISADPDGDYWLYAL